MFWGEQTRILASDTGCRDGKVLEECVGGGVTLFHREEAQDWARLVGGWELKGKEAAAGGGGTGRCGFLCPSWGEEQSQGPNFLPHSPLPLLPPPPPTSVTFSDAEA